MVNTICIAKDEGQNMYKDSKLRLLIEDVAYDQYYIWIDEEE
jgi:hypothetical protein